MTCPVRFSHLQEGSELHLAFRRGDEKFEVNLVRGTSAA